MTDEQRVEEVLKVAQTFLGVREELNNRGPIADFCNWNLIRDWRDYPLGGKGAPWCSSWTQLVGRLALGSSWPFPQAPWVSSVQKIAEWGAQQGINVMEPKRGDLFCVGHNGGWGHVAFVTEVLLDWKVRTVEGNANDGGSFNGNGVYALTRSVRPADRLLRWTRLFTNQTGPLG